MRTWSKLLGAVLILSILGGTGAPAVAQDEALPAFTAISGTAAADPMSVSGPVVIEETTSVPHAYAQGYDAVISLRADDPRLSGTYETTQNYIQLAPGLEGGFVRAGRGRITNEGGSWLTDFRGLTPTGLAPGQREHVLHPAVLALASLPALAQDAAAPTTTRSVADISGSGQIALAGEPVSFSLDVWSLPDGSVTGHATFDDDRAASQWVVDGVSVDEHDAYVCCIDVSVESPGPWVGTRWAFRVVDNGPAEHLSPDRLSLPRGPVFLPCDHPQFRSSFGSSALHDVERGDIAVRSEPAP